MSWKAKLLSSSNVAPTLADAIRVSAAEAAWTLGDAVKIMDANTSDDDFIITHISVEYCDIWDGFYEGLL